MRLGSLCEGRFAKSGKECSDVVVDILVDISGPHVVEVVVVFYDLALSAAWEQVAELSVVRRGHEHVVATCEEQNLYISEGCLELSGVVLGRVVSTVGELVLSGGPEVELLEVACADHLDPVQDVLGGGATYIVAAHHWEHAQVQMKLFVEPNDGLNYVPNEAGEIVQEGGRPVGNRWKVKEAVHILHDQVRHLQQAKSGHEDTVLVVQMHNWGHAYESFEVFSKSRVEGIGDEPLGRALGVAEPNYLIEAGLVAHVMDVGGHVVLAHVVHGKVPEGLVVGSKREVFV
jgi:hypothetical protein